MRSPAPNTEVRGLAHVAAVSFLASRLAPGGQFWVALAGGVALSRAAATKGLRHGYGASLAAMLETVALIGPARISGPLTQALNAPLAGHLYARGRPRWVQIAAVLAIRLVHYAVLNVLLIWLVVGGLDEFVDTYDKTAGWLGFPEGQTAAVTLTIVGALGWGVFYSVVQVLVYARALRRWEEAPRVAVPESPPGHPLKVPRRALAVVLLAVLACAAPIAFLTWPVLGGVAAFLVIGWFGMRIHDPDALKVGFALGLALAFGAVFPVIMGVVDADDGFRRASRALEIVLVATWARGALGTDGVRAAAAAGLWRLRRVPAAAEGASLTAAIASDERLADAGRTLLDAMKDVPHKPLPVADALTSWVREEAQRATGQRPGPEDASTLSELAIPRPVP